MAYEPLKDLTDEELEYFLNAYFYAPLRDGKSQLRWELIHSLLQEQIRRLEKGK